MGKRCSVESCTSDSRKKEHDGVTFHKVPPHGDLRPKWLSLCHIPPEKMNAKMIFVCSRHFLKANFCNFKGTKYMLKQGVLPSVFPWSKTPPTVTEITETVTRRRKIITKRRTTERKPDVSKLPVEKETDSHVAGNNQSAPETDDNSDFVETESSSTKPKAKPQSILKSYIKTLIKSKDKEKEIKESARESVVKPKPEEVQQIEKPPAPATPTTKTTRLINFFVNAPIEVLDNNNAWCPAKVTEMDYEENEILIRFDQFPNKCDEWISMKSLRIRPLQPELICPKGGFQVGQRCMAQWSDVGKFPATIVDLLQNDFYEVLFDDGFRKAIKSTKITKMAATTKPPQASPLFDPIQSSKQERRDKKRKLNVAALFQKRPRSSFAGGKNSPLSGGEASGSQDEAPPPNPKADPWYPDWDGNRPVGVESTLECIEGWRRSVVVPDPKLPSGWKKHLSQRVSGTNVGKWDCVIVAPDGKRFRSKMDIKNYLDLHPSIKADPEMFQFGVCGNRGSKKKGKRVPPVAAQTVAPIEEGAANKRAEDLLVDRTPKSAKRRRGKTVKAKIEAPHPVDLPSEELPPPSVDNIEQEVVEESPTLKISYDNGTYKCPIEGCDKNYRRENLALMHVKHYHPEYTKYLNSTPNVADLAYARTVGENFDRSASTPRLSGHKTDKAPVTPKTPKPIMGAHLDQASDNLTAPDTIRSNNIEIIKLLNQKPVDIGGDLNPLPPGLPSNMYPDINLKDLLGKTDDVAMRDDINIKNLCSSRPSQGIKTLLPVRPAAQKSEAIDEKSGNKRKRAPFESADALKASTCATPLYDSLNTSSLQEQQQQYHLTSNTATDITSTPVIPSAFDLAPPPHGLEGAQAPTVTQFDGVIIEGGKIIKIERMKQEEIINCTCGFAEEDGLMIQCELCLCWQHAYCNSIMKESEVPEKYVCYICQNPARERRSMKYVHDQDWLKHGTLPVGSYHSVNEKELKERCEKFRKCHDVIGGLCELEEYMRSLDVKMKIAKAKDHPKLYLWSKPWDKPKPEKQIIKEETIENSKTHKFQREYSENSLDIEKNDPQHDSMLMMMLKSGKEEMPMLNVHTNAGPIIPKPQAAIVPVDCKLNLLDHIGHSHGLVMDRLDEFERQLDALEEGLNVKQDDNYPKTRQALMMLARDLNTLKRFSELSGA